MYNASPGGRPSPASKHPPPFAGYPSPNPQDGTAWFSSAPVANSRTGKPQKGGNGNGKTRGQSHSPGPRKRKKSYAVQFILFFLLLAAIGVTGIWFYISNIQAEVRPYLSVFLDNVYVDGINLSGMKWSEGVEAVWAQAQAKQGSWYVRLKSPTGIYNDITAETLGISFDPSLALEQAWAVGHDTSATNRRTIFELKAEVDRMRGSRVDYYSVEHSADTSPIDGILQSLVNAAYVAPQDAQAIGFDPNNLSAPFSFQKEVYGQYLDVEAVKEEILTMVHTFQSGEITLTPTLLPPAITVADLQRNYTLRYRAYTPIDRHSTEARNNNIRVAFSKINGLVITNGSTFSFNKRVGKRTQSNGFSEALEYAYGELVTGVGGGVCQASTTIYLAAVHSGMTILERKPHSNPVNYTQMGKDATVSDRGIDFAFKNECGGTIFITAHVLKDPSNSNRLICEVRIYGPDMGNIRYNLETVPLQTIPIPEPERVRDTKGQYVVYEDEEYIVSKGNEGYRVETYLNRVVDGVQVEHAKLYTDVYPARAPRVYYGVTPRIFE